MERTKIVLAHALGLWSLLGVLILLPSLSGMPGTAAVAASVPVAVPTPDRRYVAGALQSPCLQANAWEIWAGAGRPNLPYFPTPQEAADHRATTSYGAPGADLGELCRVSGNPIPFGTDPVAQDATWPCGQCGGDRLNHITILGLRPFGVCPLGYDNVEGECVLQRPNPHKDLGTCGIGNPCNPADGNKYQIEPDYRSADGSLTFTRHYNSRFNQIVDPLGQPTIKMGAGWNANVDRAITTIEGENAAGETLTTATITRPDGRAYYFTSIDGGPYRADTDITERLVRTGNGWAYTLRDGAVETYAANGRLVSETDRAGRVTTYTYSGDDLTTITGPFGHTLSLTYASGNLATLTDPDGGVYTYTYDANGNLTQVAYPDTTTRRYHYEDTNYSSHLTGITDENGGRFATYAYNSDGRAISTEHAGGQERFTLAYDSETQTTVTDAATTQAVMTFNENLGVENLLRNINQTDGQGITQAFDANNNLIRRTDEAGRITTSTYNASNQRLSMTEAAGTPQARTTTFAYVSNDIDLPTVVAMPSVVTGQQKQVTTTYDANNNPTQITQSGFDPDGTPVSRTITLAYNPAGQVIEIDGPRTGVSDITTLTYYECTTGTECGQLLSVTNALRQTTTFDNYDTHGRVTQMTGPNNIVTTFTYDLRSRVLTQTQTPPTGPVRITTNTYDAVGQLTSTTTPDGITLTNTYDAAHNLRSIADNLGNRIEYDYDLKGNRTAERTLDPDSTLVRNIDMGYDIRNRVASINDAGSLTQLVNDAVGNLTSQTDANANPATTNSYDPLDRLSQTVDAIAGITSYGYDVNDQLTQVTAPNSANTQYVYDDLGNLLTEISPDRGTLTFGYDAAGNVTSQLDARGVNVGYSYDALNRLTFIDYAGIIEDVTFTYDTCANGVGRLCATQDESGTTSLAYDAFGNVTQQDKLELGQTYITQYTYDLGDRVTSMTYPDGRLATYTRDGLGRITDVSTTVDDATTNLVNNLTYRADGLLTDQTFGNGIVETRAYDRQGRLLTQTIGTTDTRIYTYDANGNVTAFTGNAASAAYGYDELDRLTQDTASISTSSFTYDANGNRLTVDNHGYAYAPASNRLVSDRNVPVQTDPAGNVIAYFSDNFREVTNIYNQAGRLATQVMRDRCLRCTTLNGLRPRPAVPVTKLLYTYNAQGQRTRKVTRSEGKVTPQGGTTVYHYDLLGNLIAETTDTGTPLRDYLWADNRPLVQIDTGTTDVLLYLHTDHLNTPRLATNTESAIVWRWEGQAFGATLPDEDPDANGRRVTVNLRFPGQYHDAETGLYYNWFRYYDPGTGRYVTSDPIGLRAASNTYVYAANNSIRFKDPLGLFTFEEVIEELESDMIPIKDPEGFLIGAQSAIEKRRCKGKVLAGCEWPCILDVLGVEALTQVGVPIAREIAKDLGSKNGAKLIPIFGQILTGKSVFDIFECERKCLAKPDLFRSCEFGCDAN